jgi:ParB/RepB/Spo0J family partition protein
MPSSSRKSTVSLLEHLRTEKQQGPLTQADIATEVKASLKVARDVVLIPLEQIDEGRFNPRRGFDERELEALADTIGTTGLVHPLLVRSNPDDPRRFETIAGARRLRAAHIVWGRGDLAERARVAELPCMIKEFSDTQAFISAVAENASRSDLTLAEMIDAVRRLRDETQWSGSEIARRIGRHKGYVSELLAVADNKDLSGLVGEEVIAPKTAVVIAHMPDALKRVAIERARTGQLRTKADAERLRMHDRLLQKPHNAPLPRAASVAAPPAAQAPQAPQAPNPAPDAAGGGSPVNHSSVINIFKQGSPANPGAAGGPAGGADQSGGTKPGQPGTSVAPCIAPAEPQRGEGEPALGRDPRAVRLAEAMAVAVDAFVDYMREAPRLPEDDPAIVLAQRARKNLAVFEAMRHVNG